MKKMNKILLFSLLPLSVFAVDSVSFIDTKVEDSEKEEIFKSTSLYNIKSKDLLERETKIRNYQSIKTEQEILKNILYKFQLLENALENFEEKEIINNLKNKFADKYIIKQVDILDINTELNKAIGK